MNIIYVSCLKLGGLKTSRCGKKQKKNAWLQQTFTNLFPGQFNLHPLATKGPWTPRDVHIMNTARLPI